MTRQTFALFAAFALGLSSLPAQDTNATTNLVSLNLKLPEPAFVGTPKDASADPNIEQPASEPHPPLMVPAGVKNIAPGSKITSSDPNAGPDILAKLTDGQKESLDDNVVMLRKGVQWVQFDLGAEQEIYAIAVWHAFDTPRVYRGVIAQVSDDPNFASGVQTVFNNDADNSDKLGAGQNKQYFESNFGKVIETQGVKARYVRLYSHGSTDSSLNQYIEVEIYGRPAK